MEQSAFDTFAANVKVLDDKGYKLDSINPNNLIVDNEKGTINVIDYFKVKENEHPLYQNSHLDMVSLILDFTLFPEYFDKLDKAHKNELLGNVETILKKSYLAAKKAGLSTDVERYRTFVNTTSKWFPVKGVKKDDGTEYIRSYDKRMVDFLHMLENPYGWAKDRI